MERPRAERMILVVLLLLLFCIFFFLNMGRGNGAIVVDHHPVYVLN